MKKQISLGSIGGTISMMRDSSGGITPKLDARDFIQTLPEIHAIADIKTHALFAIASGHIKFAHLLEAYHWAKGEVKQGAQGIIITQGTDTLEESAFFLRLLWDEEIPLVLTGAMRGASELGADGLANLYHACLTATHPKAHGVMVVMNNTIHNPLWLQKTHSLALETFSSSCHEFGMIIENKVEFFHLPKNLPTFAPQSIDKKVLAYTHSIDDGKELLEWASTHYDGIVLGGYGAGHTHLDALPLIPKITSKIPLIICARTPYGPSALATYGYGGSEIDLQSKGAVMSRWLDTKKSRILLSVLLSSNHGIEDFIAYRDAML